MPKIDNKKLMQIIYIIFVTGVVLLFLSKLDTGTKKEETKSVTEIEDAVNETLELRMQQALSLVEGVGEVRVIINYGTTQAKVLAKNKTEDISDTEKHFEENVVLGSDSRPVVLRENAKEIKGVLIIAQGGGNTAVKAELISAAQALLGVEPHKIEVLKMRSKNQGG